MPKTLPVVDMTSPVCCSPVAAGPVDDDAALEIALRLKALADPARVKLVSLLFSSDEGEECSCALAVAVDVNDGGVNHCVFHVGIIGDGVEQPLPDTRLRPVAKARESAVPVAERGRQITPGAAGSGDPQHGLDK